MLANIKETHPFVYRYFSSVADGEQHFRRIREIDHYWETFSQDNVPLVVLDGSELPGYATFSGDFDIIYAGGTLGLLHAAVMGSVYRRSIVLIDSHTPGRSTRDWNISRGELDALCRTGLLTEEEIEECIVCRYKTGWAEFFVDNGRQRRLYLDNVLDCAVDADRLLGKALDKLLGNPECRVYGGTTFKKLYRFDDYVVAEVVGADGQTLYCRAKVFVDAMGVLSPVAMQLNDGDPHTHVCPTVGTISTGLEGVDHEIGEILVSTEPADMSAGSGRQLIWEGFPAGNGKYTTYLFFYDAVDSDNDKSLLGLFEAYFRKLPDYKKPGEDFAIERPVYGIIPAYFHDGFGCTRVIAADRILMLGDAATLGSPLTFCGFGSMVRNLERLAEGLECALGEGSLSAERLCTISAYEPNVAAMANLMKYMCYDREKDSPNFVNEMMNEVMIVLDELPPRYREAMFRDTLQFSEMMTIGVNVALKYPEVLRVTALKLGLDGSLGMIKNFVGWAFSPSP